MYSVIITVILHLSLSDLNLRLAGAPISNAGRVEVYYTGVWGTISGYYWDINDAHVVCRQLGYPGAISYGWRNQFGAGTGPIWFQNVRCLGNESSFSECSKDVYADPNSHSANVATALCKLQYQPGEKKNVIFTYLFVCLFIYIHLFDLSSWN